MGLVCRVFLSKISFALSEAKVYLASLNSTEHVDWDEWAGMAKIGGTFVCIGGAILMSTYKGPVIWGDGFLDMHMQGAVFGQPSPEPVGWFIEVLLELGLDTWHIGIVCLVGNCFCMALYIAFQVCVNNSASMVIFLATTALHVIFLILIICLCICRHRCWQDIRHLCL